MGGYCEGFEGGKKMKYVNLAAMGVVAAACILSGGFAVGYVDHSGFFPVPYSDWWNCQICHIRQGDEVMGSVHYLWRSENPLVEFPGGGAHGMVDRACGLVGSNALINYYERCGKCHVGDSLPFVNPQTGMFTPAQKTGIDCMICHAPDGMYDMNGDGVSEEGERADARPLVADPVSGKLEWRKEERTEAARSVGKRVTNEGCLRCHEHGQGDYHYKRGTPFKPDTDVHAAAGMFCTDCHEVDHHRIARGSRVTDMFAWERQDVDVNCQKCHTDAPHKATPILNEHTDVIGCETCHIPEVSGAQRRVWAPTFGVTAGPESQIPIFDEASGTYQPYTVYDEGLVSPSYRWFAGGSSMLAEPVDSPGAFNMQPATGNTPGAKILPFRKFVSGQPMDGRGIPGVPGFDANFTMGAALNQMAPMLKMTGFMRPEGMTAAEAAMMSQFPNMLLFDRADYFANGDVAAAVSIGMARQGAFMQGMDSSGMTREELTGMGWQMWSGVAAGLDLPNSPYAPGYIADKDPTTVTGSFITVSHAIKRRGALSCYDCHRTGGRLDLKALGYSDQRRLELTEPGLMHSKIEEYKGPQTCVKCHDKQAEDMFDSVHYQWNGETPNVANIDGKAGKGNNAYDTYCGATKASRRIVCRECHVGTGKPVRETADAEQLANIDCLMCHQDAYKRKPAPTVISGDFDGSQRVDLADFAQMAAAWDDKEGVEAVDLTYDWRLDIFDLVIFSNHWLERGGGEKLTLVDYLGTERTWTLPYEGPEGNFTLVPDVDAMGGVTMLDAARTVHMPTRASCLQCHGTAGGGNGIKRGDLAMESVNPPRDIDVHLSPDGANLTCQACHKTDNHRMLGRGVDIGVSDRPGTITCEGSKCHSSKPHKKTRLNNHASHVACQTCHISSYGRVAATEVSRDWLDPHWVQGVYSGQGGYKPREYTESNVIPTYRWYDGTSDVYVLGQVARERADGMFETAEPIGSVNTDSKIYPMKEHTSTAGRHTATGEMIPYSTTKFFFTGSFDDAMADGLEAQGLSGDWTVETAHAYQSLNHSVEPAAKALQCADCHQEAGKPAPRMDLVGDLGYELKWVVASAVCAQCHSETMEIRPFYEMHSVHVDSEKIQCGICHKFQRPERNLSNCFECH
jgi:hypothetical protein